jgi:hypothetical protein
MTRSYKRNVERTETFCVYFNWLVETVGAPEAAKLLAPVTETFCYEFTRLGNGLRVICEDMFTALHAVLPLHGDFMLWYKLFTQLSLRMDLSDYSHEEVRELLLRALKRIEIKVAEAVAGAYVDLFIVEQYIRQVGYTQIFRDL